MLGSTTLHGWIESAWYLQAMPNDGEAAEVVLEREFRGAGLHQKLDLRIEMGDMGDPHYAVSIADHQEEQAPGKRANPETIINEVQVVISSRQGVSESYIEKNTGYNSKQIRETVDILISRDICYRDSGKVYLNKGKLR